MRPEYKIIGKIGTDDQPMFICRIRMEVELLLTKDTYIEINRRLGSLREDTQEESERVFLTELTELVKKNGNLVSETKWPKDLIRMIETPWAEFTNPVDISTLANFAKITKDFQAFRIDYNGPRSNDAVLVYNYGINVAKYRLNKAVAEDLKAQLEQVLSDLNNPAPAGFEPENTVLAIEIVALGLTLLAGYLLYEAAERLADEERRRNEIEKAKQKDAEAQQERDNSDRGEVREFAGGGGGGEPYLREA